MEERRLPPPEGTSVLGLAQARSAAILCVATPAARSLRLPARGSPNAFIEADAAASESPWLGTGSQPPRQEKTGPGHRAPAPQFGRPVALTARSPACVLCISAAALRELGMRKLL